jgi:hypothetical protein
MPAGLRLTSTKTAGDIEQEVELLDLLIRRPRLQLGCINLAAKYVRDRDFFSIRSAQSPEQFQCLLFGGYNPGN